MAKQASKYPFRDLSSTKPNVTGVAIFYNNGYRIFNIFTTDIRVDFNT